MPIYEYVCENGHRFDVIHGIHDAGPSECPVCQSRIVRKAIAAPAIHFKGSGWAKKDRSATAKPGGPSTETTPSETSGPPPDTSAGTPPSSATRTAKEPASEEQGTKSSASTKGESD